MTNDGTPTPDDEILREANEIIVSMQEQVNVEAIFTVAARVGTMLVYWRKLMIDGEFSEEWVEAAAMILYQKFFTPWEPRDDNESDDGDDDD